MSEVRQKQRNQSLNIQEQSFKGVLIKRCSEICSKFTGKHLCRSVISMQMLGLLLKPGSLKKWTLKNMDPKKTWNLENMNPRKYGVNMRGIKKYV